jgi:hypothetical protein
MLCLSRQCGNPGELQQILKAVVNPERFTIEVVLIPCNYGEYGSMHSQG